MIFRIAWRYIIGKKTTQAIQIISWVSIIAMAVGTACLIIVLSVFNGFEGFIKNLYGDYYAEARIVPVSGRAFDTNPILLEHLKAAPQIEYVSYTLEEKVLLAYEENQSIAIIKGVDTMYEKVNQIKPHIKYGEFELQTINQIPCAILGIGLANRLGVSEASPLPLNAYIFKNGLASMTLNPDDIYANQLFSVKGIYVLQEDIDNQVAFAPLSYVQSLSGRINQISAIEIKLKQGYSYESLQSELQAFLTPLHLKSESRLEQNKTLYFILKNERFAVFAILSLMLAIASFNIIGSLSMLVIEKEKDIAILQAMGMSKSKVVKIFLSCGILLSVFGAFIGCSLAFIVCFLQKSFGFVKLGSSGNFLIDAYPVDMKVMDFIMVLLTVIIIAIIASYMPAMKAAKGNIVRRTD